MAAHRLRCREAVRGLIADMVEHLDEIDGEIRNLFAALSRPESRDAL